MAIELRTFASGDTDYIAKLNENMAALTAAINGLQSQVGAIGGGTPLSVGQLMTALFNNADALIGPTSYKPTQSATTVTVAPGGMYLAEEHTVVMSGMATNINFSGIPAGTYYLVVNMAGGIGRTDQQFGGTAYSIEWGGSAFVGQPTQIAKVFFDTSEADASRRSSTMTLGSPPEDQHFANLDARFEFVEGYAEAAKELANEAIDIAMAGGSGVGTGIRKVGLSLDGGGTELTTGVKGAIQLDFSGTILGWSVTANTSGNLQVEVSRKASSAPPAAPAIPNTTTDKISTSPIALASAQSAAAGEAEVVGWTKDLDQWDVIQFHVLSVSMITRAVLYVRIQETEASPG